MTGANKNLPTFCCTLCFNLWIGKSKKNCSKCKKYYTNPKINKHLKPSFVVVQNSTSQSESLLRLTQKKFFPFSERKNTRSPFCCSTIHSDSDCIKLQNRFFAFLLLGETNAVFIVQKCDSDQSSLSLYFAIPS